ncbi:MAG: response regulator, partial [Chloroflexi bacterium]|nr:response regulator [Chloroflexota bacterium]
MADEGRVISVLIVEDSATQAEKLRASLEAHGFAVAVAADGAEGITVAREHRPDIVVSDIVMPGMDGYGLCRAIKADEGLKGTPVILLTSLSDPQDVIRGLECGADGFIVKTGSETLVLEGIERLLRNRELNARESDPSGIRTRFDGQERRIVAEPQRIFDFLISTYDAAMRSNLELIGVRDELRMLNDQLETKVKDRTEELSAMHQQLWHAAKLATVGELTASIAHELNNPLQTVSLHVESLSTRLSGDQAALKALSVVENELDRMANLVKNLLQLSRREEQRISTVNVAEEAAKTVELLHYHLRKCGIEVKKDLPPDIPMISADPEQLRQVFLNLFINASDAMPSGGILTLRARGGQNLLIEIVDTGTGIAAADLPRVMETFFTTKPPGKGTGLGLPICRRIVEA